MKLACQEGLVPGASLKEKVAKLDRWGYEGLELWGRDLDARMDEIRSALEGTNVKVSSICAGFRGALLAGKKEDRQQAFDDIVVRLQWAEQLGARGVIIVPIFGGPQLQDLSPWKAPRQLEDELLTELLASLSEKAAEIGSDVILEPLNRYETHYLNRLEQAAQFCEKVNGKGISLMADFFHMGIEEADPAASIRSAKAYLSHVHLADSNRMLPGQGHRDFVPGLQALKDIGYSGYMAIESGIIGDPDEGLKKSADFMHGLINELI